MPSTINDSDFRSKIAYEDLSSSQYLFVVLRSDDTVEAADADADVSYGVLQNAPIAGEKALVKVSGESLVRANEVLAINDFIGPGPTGEATITTSKYRGRVIKACGANDDICAVQLLETAFEVSYSSSSSSNSVSSESSSSDSVSSSSDSSESSTSSTSVSSVSSDSSESSESSTSSTSVSSVSSDSSESSESSTSVP